MGSPGDLWVFEKNARGQGYSRIAGIDEAGRGPLAGPVVAAAVVLPEDCDTSGITDSKKLTPRQRDRLYDRIRETALSVGVGIVGPAEIDTINILNAALLSMALAVGDLSLPPDYLLIDGNREIPLSLPQKPVVKGDSLSISIAAASIVAKVTRDRMMDDLDRLYPQYDLARHKGYPTPLHRDAIRRFGASPIHRRTFRGVREYI